MDILTESEFQTRVNAIDNCFFISVGANDGKLYDPLRKSILKHNWSGIFVEPGKEAFTRLQTNYKKMTDVFFENSAIAENDGEVTLYCGTTDIHFTMSLRQAKHMFDVEPTAITVPALTFDSLLQKYNVSKVDVLMIDVEGYDFKLLRTFPFEQIRPKVVRCEFINISNENDSLEDVITFLTDRNYDCYIDETKNDVIGIANAQKIIVSEKPTVVHMNRHREQNSKPTLRIHNPCNIHTRYFRYYNLFWDMLTHDLKRNYTIEENRYFEHAHAERYRINLTGGNEENFELQECDYLIENLDTKEFYVLSVSDDLNSAILREQDNPNLKKVLMAQYIRTKILNHLHNKQNIRKYLPWLYFPSDLTNLDQYYYKRKYLYKNNLIDKMIFRGSIDRGARPILCDFQSEHLVGYEFIGTQQKYFEELIQYKIALSVGGRGELCYRDVECMALGIPILRFEIQTEVSAPLKPNHHYISIPLPDDLPRDVYEIRCDKLGSQKHAELWIQRFFEVKENEEFLEFVTNNARNYYETYLTPTASVEHTRRLLML